MGFQANVLKVMIASPGDVAPEREIATQELYRWNNANSVPRALVLQPVKWETHSSPQMGAHPQAIINDDLLLDADIVVGIFGTRIGTATQEFVSGTVEEIKRHVAAGKLAMLYFSHVPIDPNTVDQKQWEALRAFKEECKAGGLYAEYGSHEQLRTDFGHHLTIELNRPKYMWLVKPDVDVEPEDPELSAEEKRLLLASAADRSGGVLTGTTFDGFYVQANDENFVEDSPRSAALWKRVLRRLTVLGYLNQVNEELFELTEDGFARVDKELGNLPLEVSLSFSGPPNQQALSIEANKRVIVKRLDYLTSSGAQISSAALNDQEDSPTACIPIEHAEVVSLFNAPRPDRNPSDHAGPANLRVVFVASGRRKEIVLPVLLQPQFVNNTQWIQLMGAKVFELKAEE